MSEQKPLLNKEAISKVKDMLGDDKIVVFCCHLQNKPFSATPMSTQEVDEQGNIWFFSSKASDRNKYVANDPHVQLTLSNTSDMDFISLYGAAEILEDRKKAEGLWSKHVEAWFAEGPGDPDLTLIKFTPIEGFYWDTRHGKLMAIANWMISMVTGSEENESVEGKLKF